MIVLIGVNALLRVIYVELIGLQLLQNFVVDLYLIVYFNPTIKTSQIPGFDYIRRLCPLML